MTTTRVGTENKLYINTGTHASPTWVLIGRAKDVSVPASKSEADVSRRESKNKKTRGAQIEFGVDFGYQYKAGTDDVLDDLRDSFLNGTPIELAVMDGAIATSGSKGWRMYVEVMEFPTEEPLTDGKTIAIATKHTDYEESSTLIEPDYYVVS